MYNTQYNNNELFNILKEQRLYSNLSRKSLGELEKIREMTSNRNIENFLREKLAVSGLPNINQFESILQDLISQKGNKIEGEDKKKKK